MDGVQYVLYGVQMEAAMGHQVVLFHSALGLRPSVRAWAGRLARGGHVVHTPDLYDGEVFDDLVDGVRKRDEVGMNDLIGRAQASVAAIPGPIVVAGFSMGAAAAEVVATSRPDVRAAILMHGAVPPAMMGVTRWPSSVAVQLHYAELDPWIESDDVRDLSEAVSASGGRLEVHRYEGTAHLFADEQLVDHDEGKAAAMFSRVTAFLASLEG
jgi:dienelactone hydrolase